MHTIQLYESIINKALSVAIESFQDTKSIHKDKLDPANSGAVLASYLHGVIEEGLRHFNKADELGVQIDIANQLIARLGELILDVELEQKVIVEEFLLRGITEKLVKKERFEELRPITSVAKSSLFTGGDYEPTVYSELKREIASADRIDLLVSFIKHSGLRLIYDDLVEHTKTKKLRVITTSYMGASDFKAIKMLAELPNTEVRISYDTNRTRLHAKAYYFHRESGFSTAYIGSSNLSKAALSEGTEWNLKISEYSSFDIIQKYRITFETYWNISEFQNFDPNNLEDVKRLKVSLSEEGNRGSHEENLYYFDLVPYAYQQAILDRLEVERQVYGSFKNLIVAATGTGKTIVSAFDFKRFYRTNPSAKVLFLAHREEILRQSLSAFRGVLRDHNFGELWVGGNVPNDYSHVFASIQTLNSSGQYLNFAPDYFDYIVLDETHHSAADSYKRITAHFTPQILLGLTATPERMDGEDILSDFNNRIAYEIRLREAIERNLLCPFHYFGISDEIDLSTVKWRNGRYDEAELSGKYINNVIRDSGIFKAIEQYVTSTSDMKGLGFCVTKDHARYMAAIFNRSNIPALHLDSDSSKEERRSVQSKLLSGEIKIIFVVDLYNEGIDIPEVNVVLFLRPTESPTIFIQQLGRGLRLYPEKEVLTVLDFIGQAHQQYDYRMKFQSLVGRTHHSLVAEIAEDFPSLPNNCFIQLERVAKDRVLKNIESVYINKRRLVRLVREFALHSTQEMTLTNFMLNYQLEPLEIYKFTTWTQLVNTEYAVNPLSPFEAVSKLNTVFAKVAKIDSLELLRFVHRYLTEPIVPLSEREKRLAVMFYYTVFDKPFAGSLGDFVMNLKAYSAELVAELVEVVLYQMQQIDHIPSKLALSEEIPLELHGSYSTSQILTAVGENTIEFKKAFREGVTYIKAYNLDLFFITLNKTEKHFKESTRYEDYAINESTFHWQSQSRTSVNSPTGQRYTHQKTNGSKVILFVREEKEDLYGNTEVYRCLGLADYVSHQGSAPISITYTLHNKMPMHIFKKSNQIVKIV